MLQVLKQHPLRVLGSHENYGRIQSILYNKVTLSQDLKLDPKNPAFLGLTEAGCILAGLARSSQMRAAVVTLDSKSVTCDSKPVTCDSVCILFVLSPIKSSS